MPKIQIERYFEDACLIPPLRAIGQSRQTAAREGLFPHHEAYFEIHLIMDGTVHWWVEDETYTLPPGTIFITKPHELHGSFENRLQPCSLYWLQVDPQALTDPSIQRELDQLNGRFWEGADELVPHVTAMLAECRQPQPDSPRVLSAALNLFLSLLLRQHQNQTRPKPLPPQLEELSRYIEQQIDRASAVSVADLCERVGLSRSRIFQLFNQYFGQSPISYINSQRVDRAKQQLQFSSTAVTDIALEIGFSSSQHFATVFKRYTGLSPLAYRRSVEMGEDMERKQIGRMHQRGHR